MSGGGRKPQITGAKIVAAIRAHGPMTAQQMSERLRCSPVTINEHLRKARGNRLVTIIGKHDRRQFIFGAVQTVDWPPKQEIAA